MTKSRRQTRRIPLSSSSPLIQTLSEIALCRPLVLLGVGSELRGDDGWTHLLITQLQKAVPPDVHCLWGSTLPENFVKPIAARKPKAVLVIDSADMNAPASMVRLFVTDEVPGPATQAIASVVLREVGGTAVSGSADTDGSFLSHRLPLTVFASLVRERAGCPVYFLFMQPENIEFSAVLSPKVRSATQRLLKLLKGLLRGENAATRRPAQR